MESIATPRPVVDYADGGEEEPYQPPEPVADDSEPFGDNSQHEQQQHSQNPHQNEVQDPHGGPTPNNSLSEIKQEIGDSSHTADLPLPTLPKVKLEAGAVPPELEYGRRKRRPKASRESGDGEEGDKPKRVKLIISSRKLHPGTKSSTVVEPPPGSLNGGNGPEQTFIPTAPPRARTAYKRKRKPAANNIPNSMPPTSQGLLDAFQECFNEDYDDDDGFTTIKDLAERGITKMEPLDYDDFNRGYYRGYYTDSHRRPSGSNKVKHENNSNYDLDKVKNEPGLWEADEDPDYVPPVGDLEAGGGQEQQSSSNDNVAGGPGSVNAERKADSEYFKREPGFEDEGFDDDEASGGRGKFPRKWYTGYKPAPDRRIYGCLYCSYNGRKHEWLNHLKSQHPDKTLYYCPVTKCQMPFETQELMEEHNRESHQRNVCTFEGCGKEFKWKSILREHRKTHFPSDADWMADPDPGVKVDRFFVCTFCGKSYRTRSGWRAHEAYNHTKQLDFKCDFEGCDKAFFQESELTIHKRKHTGEQPFTCSYCGNRYISAHTLAQHEKAAHLETEDVECEVCNKKVRKRNLAAHVKTHYGFSGYPCSVCGKEFPTVTSRKRHEKIHFEEKEHKCQYCGKAFVQKANMQAHERIHTGERPFKCLYCMEGFVQLTRRKQHEATCKMRR